MKKDSQNLERLIIDLVERQLSSFRYDLANPGKLAELHNTTESEAVREEADKHFYTITAYTELAMIQDNGMSEDTCKKLIELNDECSALMRSLDYLFSRPAHNKP